MTAVTENGETTTYAYDELSQPDSVTYSDGSTEYTEYDKLGNIVKQTDTNGDITSYGYTVENMVSRVTYPDGDTLHYGYDKAGNLVRETNANGGITRYEYDLLGQLTGIDTADGTATEYKYNADGEVISELVRSIAYSGEEIGENHYSNLAYTSSEPLVATAIRNVEDAFDSSKGSSFPKPTPKKPTPAKPKTPAQEYAKARRQATTPTMDEYQQLLRIGYTGGFGQYANDKQRSNFPSPAEYMYNKQQGRPNYQNFGPVEVVRYQNGETYYRVSHASANGTPKVESVNPKLDYYCDVVDRIANINFQGAGDYDEIGDAIGITVELLKKLKSLDDSYRAGHNSVLLEKIVKPFIDVIGAMEQPFNDRMPVANYLHSKNNELLRDLERNAESSIAYSLGRVLTDIEAIAVDFASYIGSGKAAKIIIRGIKGGEVLAGIQVSTRAIKAVAGVAASADVFGNGTNLGNDLKDLISAIKGNNEANRVYAPSPKHNPLGKWGSENPIPNDEVGQELLDSAYSSSDSKQLYNIYEGDIIKFQPDGSSGEWHAYKVSNTAKEVPTDVYKQMLEDGLITKADYKKLINNKWY